MQGKTLVNKIRAGFITKGTSLHAYCLNEDIDSSNAHKALMGRWKGTKALILMNKLITDSGVAAESCGDKSAD